MKARLLAVALFGIAAQTAFAATNTYQVTGPLLDVSDDRIVVEKNKEKWEIARDKDTKVKGDLKKGSRVTVQYRMTAASIEAKDGKDAKDAKDSGKDSAKDSAKDKGAGKDAKAGAKK